MAFLPYVYIFLSAWKFGQKGSGASGLFVTLIAMGSLLIPSAASVLLFEAKVIGGSALLVLAGWLAFLAGTRRRALTTV